MNRRQFLAVSLLPIAASAVGIPVFARVPHFVLLAENGDVVARSAELPSDFLAWLRREHTVEGMRSVQLVFQADREVTVVHYELRDCEIPPEFKCRRSLDEPIWLRGGDKLDFTWQWKAERKAQGFGGTLQ